VLIGWFPDKRGLITGLAVTGFGLGALVTGPLATQLIQTIGVQHTLMLLGVMYLLIVVLAAQFLVAAPEGYAASARASSTHGLPTATAHATLPEALRTPHWYVLWLMLAVNVTAGAAIISVAAPLAQELTRVSSTTAALAVCLVALFNGAGRLFWGAMSDRFGRPRAFLAIFLSQVLAFALIPEIGDFVPLLFPLALIALCYGGGFGIMPAFATDVFGSRHSGTIYGAMLTAWSAGAVAGPVLISALPYRTALSLIALLLAVATVLPLMFNALVQLKLKASLPDRAGLDAMAS
jgi:MFS transporter, OFA family, oxalate/formate antiporter